MTALRMLAVALLIAVGAPVAAAADSAPPGATARCKNNTYSFSQHRSGTCSRNGGVAEWLTGTSGGGSTPPASAPSAPSVSTPVNIGRTVLLARRSRSAGCVRSVRPDRRCSPGAYYTGLTRAVLCSSSFRTGTIRNVPESEKYAVEREYGMPAHPYGRTIEIDHIVSLELGGSNDIANLFPEPGSGSASYHAKDVLENRLHDMVCAGQISLRAAQQQIAANWGGLYQRVFGRQP